ATLVAAGASSASTTNGSTLTTAATGAALSGSSMTGVSSTTASTTPGLSATLVAPPALPERRRLLDIRFLLLVTLPVIRQKTQRHSGLSRIFPFYLLSEHE